MGGRRSGVKRRGCRDDTDWECKEKGPRLQKKGFEGQVLVVPRNIRKFESGVVDRL